jgi:pyruvate,orthophosphate dikinase
MNDRAIVYRRKYHIPSEWGTAVNVQAMVYGNTGENSGSGVAFTRDPATGEKIFYGEFLINAQGEDVVAGVRTPEPVAQLAKEMPAAYKELDNIRTTLEKHFKDVQDFEFTIQDGKVFMLQTRNGKRTAFAALKFSMDMAREAYRPETAVMQSCRSAEQFWRGVRRDRESGLRSLRSPHPGAASGGSTQCRPGGVARGEQVLLARTETCPEDLRA